MKTKNNFIRSFLVLIVVCFMLSCSPEDGAEGKQGEQGIAGVDGNANVTVYTKDLEGLQWTTVGNANNGYLSLEILAPNVLTAEVLKNSTILVYVYTSDFNSDWALLPYYTERNIRVQAAVFTGKIILKKDQDGKPYTQSWHNKLKVVIIKETSSNPLSKNAKSMDVRKMTYQQLTDYVGHKQ